MWGLFWLLVLEGVHLGHGKQRPNPRNQEIDFIIVGLFHHDQSQQEFVFRRAIESINMNPNIIPTTTLVPQVEYFSHFDSFNTSKRVCSLLMDGIGAIFELQSAGTTGIVRSMCDIMEVPHVDLRWDISSRPAGCAINLFPDSKLFALALRYVIEDMDWKRFTVLYEDYDTLVRLQEVFKASESMRDGSPPFTVRQLPVDSNDYRPLLKEIKLSGESHVVLDCPTDKIITILSQANEVKLMGEYMNIIITSLDAHTIDYGMFREDRTNITALRLIDPTSNVVTSTLKDWKYEAHKKHEPFNINATDLKTESVLIYDAVHLLARALQMHGGRIETEPLDCHEARIWNHGYSIINFMKNMEHEGLSGPMRFDEPTGHRTYFSLEIIELAKEGFKKIGSWDPENLISRTRTVSEMESEFQQSIESKLFIVSSRIDRPYLDYVPGHENKKGNDRFEGYSMDLIDAISKIQGFKYEFVLVPDSNYGKLDEKGEWNGLIKEVREKRADLAICDLTITYDRRSAVDFTMPFLTLGISILYKKDNKQELDLFSFLDPLAFNVWVTIATAYLGISFLLFIISRCSPYQWENPHPCDSEPEELELTFDLITCLWFSIGSLTTQGCDLLPKAASARIVAGMWWFFTMVMIACYTANLAAFISKQKMGNPIESIEDLANQDTIKYGVMTGGSSEKFFMESNDSTIVKLWSTMKGATPAVITESNSEGVDRVRKANKRGFAFFMESTSIEFQMEQHCDLMQIGSTIDSKGYGIALPSDSQFRNKISESILKLQEAGTLRDLKKKWWVAWKPNNTQEYCDKFLTQPRAKDIFDVEDVIGVFLVLIGGCILSFAVACFELLWNVNKIAVNEKISPWNALILELKFLAKCRGTTKPVRLIPSKSPKESPQGSIQRLNMLQLNKERSHHSPTVNGWTPPPRPDSDLTPK